MDRLGKAATVIWTILLVGGGLFIGLLIWGISFMGDRACDIEIQNNGQRILNVKTIINTGYEWTTIEDSVSLQPNDKFKIGDCINCSTLDDTDFDFNAIIFSDSLTKPRLVFRKDIVLFLSTLEKNDCATYLLKGDQLLLPTKAISHLP